jgi:hypothetical protein
MTLMYLGVGIIHTVLTTVTPVKSLLLTVMVSMSPSPCFEDSGRSPTYDSCFGLAAVCVEHVAEEEITGFGTFGCFSCEYICAVRSVCCHGGSRLCKHSGLIHAAILGLLVFGTTVVQDLVDSRGVQSNGLESFSAGDVSEGISIFLR